MPEDRPWVRLPIHERYGGPLRHLPVVKVEEMVAEKIARLTRRTDARDAHDLVWIARQGAFHSTRPSFVASPS